MRFIHQRIGVSDSPEVIATNLNNFFVGVGDISIIDFTLREREWAMAYRRGGAASYVADVLRYTPNDGNSALTTAINAQLQQTPFTDRRWPFRFYDLTPRETRGIGVVFLMISEIVLDERDGSYPAGSQEFRESRLHIVEALEDIAAGATGDVRLISSGGRYTDTTAINRSGFQFDSGSRGVALWDRDTQTLWAYPSCC